MKSCRLIIVSLVVAMASCAAAKEAILFLNAHPDDTDGFAGTAYLLKDKYEIHVVDLTRGELGLGPAGLADGSTAYRRTQEETKAQAYYGAKLHFLSEVDGSAAAGDRPASELAKILLEVKPRAVFTHWPIDNHADHAQCSAIMANALRKSGLKPERYFFEEWMRQTRNMTPTYMVDVTEVFKHKRAILSFYECQNQDGYLLKMTEKRARWRGRQRVPAVEYAEPFTTWDGRPIKGGVLEGLREAAVMPGASEVDVSTEDSLHEETLVKPGGIDRRGVAQFDVRDFGAKGDGVTKDTEAVQRAIDACVAAGGGRVVITNGTFLVAPITLGCGVELHLARGAGLLGSRDMTDYPNRSGIRHVRTDALPRKRNCSLVFAEECDGISITGEGFIDANGANFVKPKSGDDWTGWHFERNVDLDKSLPRVVFFTGCRNVRIEGMTLRNPPAGWSFWIHDCDDVLFDGVRVRADVRYPNNDGIHINSCRDVIVRNCDLETGDDSIVVRANNRSLRENRICERVVVSNCVCRSWSAGIRIAWSNDGTIRNCSFSNIRMRDTSVGIALALPGIPEWNKFDYGREATLVEDLVFEDIEMDGIYGRPILMWMSPRPDSRVEAVRRISFRNVRSTGLEKPLFMGLEEKPFDDISFTDCEFTVVGDDVLPGYQRHGAAAWDRCVGSRSCHCKIVPGRCVGGLGCP